MVTTAQLPDDVPPSPPSPPSGFTELDRGISALRGIARVLEGEGDEYPLPKHTLADMLLTLTRYMDRGLRDIILHRQAS